MGGIGKLGESSGLTSSLKEIAQTPSRFETGRPLTSKECDELENQGNSCLDWSKVRLLSEGGLERIQNNRFEGRVLISGFKGESSSSDGRSWPTGMANCRVRDAVIGNACLYDIARLENQVIEDGAIIVGVGALDCPDPTWFGLGQVIHPGTESGARKVWIWDTLTLDDAMDALALPPRAQVAIQKKVDSSLAPLQCRYGYVGAGAVILHAQQIHSAWIGPGTRISGALLIRNCALVSSPKDPCQIGEGAWLEHSLLQAGSRIESCGKVSRSILLEHSSVTMGGMVSHSVLGFKTEVSKGEINACLVGPYVGFHHQSLLISAIWPEGRGNIAYGANVGSNHTGRKPDQEIRPGEGNFFGLGCTIKFPANYSEAPYSIFAAGLTTLPQRLQFPFSLINQGAGSLPELALPFNEIIPGWTWSDNAYALVRRSYKVGSTTQVSELRSGFFTSRIFLPRIARQVLLALKSLRAAPTGLPYYLEEHIPGLGKNFLRAKTLARSIAAYEDYLGFFLMRAYADQNEKEWTQELKDLVHDLAQAIAKNRDDKTFIADQIFRIPRLKANILLSLERDDRRGKPIFDDYADFHAPPEEDGALGRLSEELDDLTKRLNGFLKAD